MLLGDRDVQRHAFRVQHATHFEGVVATGPRMRVPESLNLPRVAS